MIRTCQLIVSELVQVKIGANDSLSASEAFCKLCVKKRKETLYLDAAFIVIGKHNHPVSLYLFFFFFFLLVSSFWEQSFFLTTILDCYMTAKLVTATMTAYLQVINENI